MGPNKKGPVRGMGRAGAAWVQALILVYMVSGCHVFEDVVPGCAEVTDVASIVPRELIAEAVMEGGATVILELEVESLFGTRTRRRLEGRRLSGSQLQFLDVPPGRYEGDAISWSAVGCRLGEVPVPGPASIEVRMEAPPECTIPPDAVADARIAWDESVDGVDFGMSASQALAVLGAPDEQLSKDWELNAGGFAYHSGRHAGLTLYLTRRPDRSVAVGEVELRAPYQGTTQHGIGIGSSREALQCAFSRNVQDGWLWIGAARSAYGFHLRDDRVDAIYIYSKCPFNPDLCTP
jgi:hypothetical protein